MSKRGAAKSLGEAHLPRSAHRPWHHVAAMAVIVGAGLAAYSNSFSGPFVFDDIGSIVDNPTIRTLWPLTEMFSPPAADGQTVGGRPLLNATFAVNHALSGLAVGSYHAVNLVIHLGCGLLLYGIVRRTLGRLVVGASTSESPTAFAPGLSPSPARLVAAAAALFWVIHPLNTAAVTYIVQRAESLAGFFLLLAVYGFIRGVGHDSTLGPSPIGSRPLKWWLVLVFVACLLGMATKETMAAAPLLVFIYDRTFVAGSFSAAWSRRWRFHMGLCATWLLLAGLISGTASRGGSAGFGAVTSRWDYLLTQCEAIVRYLRLAIWPNDLTFDYGMHIVNGPADVWPEALLVLTLLGGSVWAFLRRPSLGFLCAWFFIILAPSSSVVPVTSQTMAEHRMYLPLAAIIVVAALALQNALKRSSIAAFAAIALALGAATYARNRDFRTSVDLWSDTVLKCPDNARAHTNLGSALAQSGRTEEAMRSFRDALRVYPNHASAHYNLGVALAATGRDDEALESLAAAIRLEPGLADARINLGNALIRIGRPVEAVPHYVEALRLQPEASDAELGLGLALLAAGRPAEAIPPLRRAGAAMSNHVEARVSLGNALARTGDFPAAILAYTEALRLAPDHVTARNNLANALLVVGRIRESISEYERVLRLRPGDPAIRENLEEARSMLRAAGPEGTR